MNTEDTSTYEVSFLSCSLCTLQKGDNQMKQKENKVTLDIQHEFYLQVASQILPKLTEKRIS